MVYFDQYEMEKGEKPRSRKILPFPLAACTLNFYALFYAH